MTLIAESPTPKSLDAPVVAPTAQMNGYALSLADQDLFVSRKQWTQKECDKIEELGLLIPGEYELIHGEVIEKVGQFVPHSRANVRVVLALTLTFGADYVLMPVSVPLNDTNVPEPDASVMRQTTDRYIEQRRPAPADLLLAVEISDATLWRDRNTKMVLYAQAGVPQYWVLDINGRVLWVHTNPTSTGYATIQEYDETASVLPQAAPTGSAPITVANLLP